jgi:hypothetical protein
LSLRRHIETERKIAMTLRKLTIVPMLAMALFAVGCGADCEGLCEDAKECEDAPDAVKDRDCADSCEKAQKLAEDAGCEEEYDETVSCAGDVDDICADNDDACESEGEKYGECLADYCMDHMEECLEAIGG